MQVSRADAASNSIMTIAIITTTITALLHGPKFLHGLKFRGQISLRIVVRIVNIIKKFTSVGNNNLPEQEIMQITNFD